MPLGCAAGLTITSISRPSAYDCHASVWSAGLDVNVKRETELILASASPRNPILIIASRSSKVAILLVAWRANARISSSLPIPQPLSRIRISFSPPRSMSISIRVAPASRLFSTSSLTTDAGLSTTSPAAIWLASCGERICIAMSSPLLWRCLYWIRQEILT